MVRKTNQDRIGKTKKCGKEIRKNSVDSDHYARKYKTIETKGVKKQAIPGQFCPVEKKCGGCQFLDVAYEEQLRWKQKKVEELLKPYCEVHKIKGMKQPFHYRNKVHAVFAHKRDGSIISGIYQ